MEQLKSILWGNSEDNLDWKCSVCDKFLSVAPIFYSVTIGSICGRCSTPDFLKVVASKGLLERQSVYEKTAKQLTFPCSFKSKGCKHELTWEEVTCHETSCELKNSICPFSSDDQLLCEWTGGDSEIVPHLKNEHGDSILKNPHICLAPEFKSRVFCFELVDNPIMVMFLDYKNYKYICHTFADLPSYKRNQYTCQLQMFDKIRKKFIVMEKDSFHPISSGFLDRNDDSGLEIDMYAMKEFLKKPDFEIIVDMKNKYAKPMTSEMVASEQETKFITNELDIEEVDEDWKNVMACSRCKKYLTSPIYTCIADECNMCSTCYNEKHGCVTCNSRNLAKSSFTLELLSKGLLYSCKNKKHGCSFKASAEYLREHQNSCTYSFTKCPYAISEKCNWEGSRDIIYTHIPEEHGFSSLDKIYEITLGEATFLVFSFEKKIFFLQILNFEMNGSFRFNVFCLHDEFIIYKFDLMIVGSTSMGIRMTLSHLCQPLSTCNFPKIFSGLSIESRCLKQFVTNTKVLKIKLSISRIKNKNVRS